MRERGARGASWNLGLATLAFTLCFAAWSLISPFAKGFKKELGLNYTQALLLTAVPVVLGSLARIPVGTLTDKYGGRKMFTLLLVFSAIPAVLFGYAHTYAQLIGVGFLLGMAGSSFAVGVPFVANWFKGSPRLGTAVGILTGAGLSWGNVWPLLVIGAFSIPIGLVVFKSGERYAKKRGKLKRSG